MNDDDYRRHTLSDWGLILYYGGLAASGLIGLITVNMQSVALKHSGGEVTFLILSMMYLIFGIFAAASRWIGERRLEMLGLTVLAILTFLQAIYTLYISGWPAFAVALRLMVGPGIMISYGLLRQRTVVSKRDLATGLRTHLDNLHGRSDEDGA